LKHYSLLEPDRGSNSDDFHLPSPPFHPHSFNRLLPDADQGGTGRGRHPAEVRPGQVWDLNVSQIKKETEMGEQHEYWNAARMSEGKNVQCVNW